MPKMSLSLNFVLALLINYCKCLEIPLLFLLLFYSHYAIRFPLVFHYGLQRETVRLIILRSNDYHMHILFSDYLITGLEVFSLCSYHNIAK